MDKPKWPKNVLQSQTTLVNVRVNHIRPKYDNLREWLADPNNEYIGRGGKINVDKKRFFYADGKWHNPYKITDGIKNTREKTIIKYEKYIKDKIKKDPKTYNLETLRNKNLGCWCKPEACHGDVLLKMIKDLKNPSQSFKCNKCKKYGHYTKDCDVRRL